MPSDQARPVGASGKEPLPSDAVPNQAPRPNPNPAHGPAPAANGVEAMNTLIKMRRSDPDETLTISDDEEESLVPTLGTFMNIPSALRNLGTDNPTLGLTLPTRVPVQDVSPVDVVLNPTNSDLDRSAPGNPGWHQLISAGNELASPTDQHFKNSHVNY